MLTPDLRELENNYKKSFSILTVAQLISKIKTTNFFDSEPQEKIMPSSYICAMENIGNPASVGISFRYLERYMLQRDIYPSSHGFTIYKNYSDPQKLQYKICIPIKKENISRDLITDSDVKVEIFPQQRVVSMLHIGSYKMLSKKYELLYNFIKDKGFNHTGDYIEQYLSVSDDPSLNITEIGAIII